MLPIVIPLISPLKMILLTAKENRIVLKKAEWEEKTISCMAKEFIIPPDRQLSELYIDRYVRSYSHVASYTRTDRRELDFYVAYADVVLCTIIYVLQTKTKQAALALYLRTYARTYIAHAPFCIHIHTWYIHGCLLAWCILSHIVPIWSQTIYS